MRSKDARGLGRDVPHCKHCRKSKVVKQSTHECDQILCCAIGCPFNFVESQDLAIMADKEFDAGKTATQLYRARRRKLVKDRSRVGGTRPVEHVAFIDFGASFDRKKELELIFARYKAVMRRMWNEYRQFVNEIEKTDKQGRETPAEVKVVLPVGADEGLGGASHRSKQKREGEIYLEILSQSFEIHREQQLRRL